MRPAVAAAVLGLALAVGAPTVWMLTRPAETSGASVSASLEISSAPSSTGTTAPTSSRPAIATRDAAPTAAAERPAPVRVQIPALGVDGPVDPVGVAADGQMAIPEDVGRIGWYRFGPTPGEPGSAVVAGHVDDAEQGLGELAPLREATVGDEVVVTDADGTTTRWRVVSLEVISKQVLPLDRIFGREGPPRLTLITCGGPFLPETGGYQDNVVVVAEPIR
jgi:sortase (surface protein transpeptidase)